MAFRKLILQNRKLFLVISRRILYCLIKTTEKKLILMRNPVSVSRKNKRHSSLKSESLFVFEGKNDFLLIGIIFLLLSFFLLGGFFFK